jgi:hypothetical protein
MIYISGPITNADTNIQLGNLQEFDKAATLLRAVGYTVFNPAEQEAGKTYAEYMLADLTALLECSAMVQLPGWAKSRGALIEYDIACALALPVNSLNWWLSNTPAAQS